jgi:hypothetical protein
MGGRRRAKVFGLDAFVDGREHGRCRVERSASDKADITFTNMDRAGVEFWTMCGCFGGGIENICKCPEAIFEGGRRKTEANIIMAVSDFEKQQRQMCDKVEYSARYGGRYLYITSFFSHFRRRN